MCLTNAQLMAILDGSLLPEESYYAEVHLDECASCWSLLVNLVKVLPSAALETANEPEVPRGTKLN